VTASRVWRTAEWPVRAYFALLFALCLVGALVFAFVVSAQLDRDARRSAKADAAFAARTAAKELGDHVALLEATVAQLGANPQIAQVFSNPAGCSLSFGGIGGPDRGHIDVIRADGTVACSSRGTTSGKQRVGYAGSAWFRRAMTGPVLVAPAEDAVTDAPVAVSAVPIRGGAGVVAGFADLAAWGPHLATRYGGGRGTEFLVTTGDRRTVVARSIAPERWIAASLAGTAFARDASKVERQDLDGKPRLYQVSRVAGTGWSLYAGEDRGVALASLDRLKRRQLQMIVVGLAAVLLAGWLVYRRVVAPIRRLSASVAVTAASDSLTGAVAVTGPAEVRRLANDVNALIASVNRELAERQRAEAAAQLSEENYRLVFESNPSPMWVFDLETLCFLAVNDAAVEAYGYTRSEFLSMTIEDIREPGDIPRLRSVLATPREFSQSGIWQHRRKDGSVFDAEVTSHAHQFDGRPARVVRALDVTERVRAEEALRESEARYRDLFENATDLIATTDLEGRLTGANHAFMTTLDYTREELIGRPLVDLVPPEWHESLSQAASVKLGAGGATVYEHELLARDGSRVQVEVASRLIEEDGRPVGVEAICRNISERKLLEEQLRQALRLEAIGRLAGGVAHDFNNLLTVISGYTEALLRASDGSERELNEIASAAQRAAKLTRQLLAFSRQQVLQPRLLEMNEVVEDIVPMLTRLIGEDVELSTALDPKLAPVLADSSQLEQVLVNLVVNARDAMPEGGKLVIQTANVELDARYAAEHPDATAGAHAMLSVSDNGIGMDVETASHIFEPFYTTKPVGSGTGLGLATVYGIVKQSGGTIWVYSEPGTGTTFKVYLPAAEGIVFRHEDRGPATAPIGTETILIAEDEEVLRDLTTLMLEDRGYTVIAAETPQHALDVVEQASEQIDLLLTDLVMPHMGGIELAARLRDQNPNLRVLFMSGYAGEALTQNGRLENGAGFIEKPFSSSELAQRVRAILDGREQADPQLAA
jgi:two-component system cell cycle sensor histidine kinase/response regulator CckA